MSSDQPNEIESPRRDTGINPLPLFLLLVIAAALIYWFYVRPGIAPSPEMRKGVGQPLTFVDLQPLTGDARSVATADLKNHVTLLNFWGTWCSYCRDELPPVADLAKRFAGHQAFQLLAVSCPAGGVPDDVKSLEEETAELLKKLGLSIPTYHDPNEATRRAVDKLIDFQGFPTTLLLDRAGVIRAIWVGYHPGLETEIEAHVGKLLSEKK